MITRQLERFKKFDISTRVATALIIAGMLAGGLSYLAVWLNQRSSVHPVRLSTVLNGSQPADNGSPMVSGVPVRISIPSLSINLNVIPGYYYPKTQSWTLSPVNAEYATMTAPANNKSGDTFIYGHALMNVFGRLPNIQKGGKAVVSTANGHTFTYTFQDSAVITPSDTGLFKYRGKPVLILQTCTGAWYQDRQLFLFNLQGVS